jgi:pyruvate kinase
MIADRKTKIVATLGPSLSSESQLRAAILAGLNVARLNFSHGSHEDHLQSIKWIRGISKELKTPVAILQDLQGPKIRVGKFEKGLVRLKEGALIDVSPDFELGNESQIPTDFKELPKVVKAGDRLLLDDGLLEIEVIKVDKNIVKAKVITGGELSNRKGMNLPGIALPIDCLTPKDIDDLEFGLSQGVDYVALSFVRRKEDVLRLREIVDAKSPSTKIVSKIEMLEAITHLEEIVAASDAVMVARGDLAIEAGQTTLPALQKRIIRTSNRLGKPVITATQMLESMVNNPRPTRAEITDVANAVIDGTDAVMLSAESAKGKYPIECIATMHDIILEVEKSESVYYKIKVDEEVVEVPYAIAASANLTAKRLKSPAIVCLTTSGKTATLISRFRPQARIFAVTYQLESLNRLELVWGIQSLVIKPYRSTEEALIEIEKLLLSYGLVKKGDQLILTLGVPIASKSKTNAMRVYTVTGESPAPKTDLPFRFLSGK